MILRATILLAALVVTAPALAEGEPLSVRAEVEAHALNVAQQTTLTVTCQVAQGWALVDDPFGEMAVGDSLGPLQVASAPLAEPARFASGRTAWTWTVELTPVLPATGEISALRFKAQMIDGDRFTIERTEPIPIVVESLLESENPDWDPMALRPALEPLPEPVESNAALYFSIGTLVLVGVGATALTLVSRRRRDPVRIRLRRLEGYRSALLAIDGDAPVAVVAEAAQAPLRKAMAEVAGPRALAATGAEFGSLLSRDVGLSPEDSALVCDFFARIDAALYTDGAVDPGSPGCLRDDALRAFDLIRDAVVGGGQG